jgi:hypothetical protein
VSSTSRAATPVVAVPPRWLSRVTPATAGTTLLLTAIAAGAATPVVDPDVFWHVSAGEWILKNRRIPKTDPFSWTMLGRKWIAHEWLTEIVFGALHRLGGWPALVLYAVVVITTSWAIVARTCRRLGASAFWANTITGVAALSCLHTWGARPQMLSLLFGAIYADLLIGAWQGRPRVLVWCVPIMLVWCNMHGGYMFGISMLLLFVGGLVGESVLRHFWPSRREGTTAVPRATFAWSVGALVATVAVSLANPNGVEGFLYPFSYLGDNASTRYIEEWFSPTFSRLQWWPFFALIGVAAVVAWKQRRTIPVYASVGMAIYAALGVQSVRNITQFSFFAAPFLAAALTTASAAARAQRPVASTKTPSAFATVLPMGALIGSAAIALIGLTALTPQANANAQAKEFPAGAATYLSSHPTTNLFNQYDWGGYLIWRLDQPVGIDGRPDMYGDAFVDRYVATWNAQPGWEQHIAAANVKSVLGLPNAALVKKLRAQTNIWTVAYEDPRAVLLTRS